MDVDQAAALAVPQAAQALPACNQFDILVAQNMLPLLQDTFGFIGLVILPWVLVFFLAHHLVRTGYHAFLDLGPGGTPYNFRGYVRLCILGLFVLRNPFRAPTCPFSKGYLASLPRRTGQPPRVTGIAPHRQTEQKSPDEMYLGLKDTLNSIAKMDPNGFLCEISAFEKHNRALFSTITTSGATKQSEICHIHQADGSLHLTLHPADVRTVLEAGWGIRHPLARGDWWWRWPVVPEGFIMVFAPRDTDELAVVKRIIKAAAWGHHEEHFEPEEEVKEKAMTTETTELNQTNMKY